MAQFNRPLSVYQGYNFKKDKQNPVGFLTKLKIGDTEFTADQTCKDPTNPKTDLKVVAVLNHVLWDTGITDAVQLAGQLSTANKQNVAGLVINDLVNTETVFQFSVYEFDPVEKKYFLAFHSNSTDMNGIVEKSGDDLNLHVADDPSSEVQSPLNYAFQTGIKPKPAAQSLHLATSFQKKLAKAWGLAVA